MRVRAWSQSYLAVDTTASYGGKIDLLLEFYIKMRSATVYGVM